MSWVIANMKREPVITPRKKERLSGTKYYGKH